MLHASLMLFFIDEGNVLMRRHILKTLMNVRSKSAEFDDESKAGHIAWQVYMRGRFLVRHTCISRISLD